MYLSEWFVNHSALNSLILFYIVYSVTPLRRIALTAGTQRNCGLEPANYSE